MQCINKITCICYGGIMNRNSSFVFTRIQVPGWIPTWLKIVKTKNVRMEVKRYSVIVIISKVLKPQRNIFQPYRQQCLLFYCIFNGTLMAHLYTMHCNYSIYHIIIMYSSHFGNLMNSAVYNLTLTLLN